MNFLNVAVMLAILLTAMVASMLYYGSRGKKQMGIHFRTVAERLGGNVEQRSRMYYPRLTTEVQGRPVEMFVHLSEGHRKTSDIVYLVLTTPVAIPSATLVVSEGVFTAAPDRGSFNAVAGDYLVDRMPGRYIYASDEAATDHLLSDGGVVDALAHLSRFTNLVLGPDAITAGKPYGGALDLETDRLSRELTQLVTLAQTLEAAASTGSPSTASTITNTAAAPDDTRAEAAPGTPVQA